MKGPLSMSPSQVNGPLATKLSMPVSVPETVSAPVVSVTGPPEVGLKLTVPPIPIELPTPRTGPVKETSLAPVPLTA